MELHPCNNKITTAAVALIFMIMLLLTTGGQGVCSVVNRSRTLTGACVRKDLCVAACGGEGYPDGYCFLDVAAPDHRVCMCTGPCPPELAMSRGNMV
ncbi:hypothetical protein BS78_04G052700 [Paspalum vaginatum]|nr:hypothetical protein BS78_04G052700 [Paspalum vaginatum]